MKPTVRGLQRAQQRGDGATGATGGHGASGSSDPMRRERDTQTDRQTDFVMDVLPVVATAALTSAVSRLRESVESVGRRLNRR